MTSTRLMGPVYSSVVIFPRRNSLSSTVLDDFPAQGKPTIVMSAMICQEINIVTGHEFECDTVTELAQ